MQKYSFLIVEKMNSNPLSIYLSFKDAVICHHLIIFHSGSNPPQCEIALYHVGLQITNVRYL